MKRFIALLTIALSSLGFAHAQTPDINQQYVHTFAIEYAKYKTLGELISKTNIPFGEYVFLKRKLGKMQADKPPEVREVNGTLQFITKEMTVSLRPVSLAQKKFEVNGKILSLLGVSPARKWELLAQALPKDRSALLWDLLLPRAEAQWQGGVARAVTWLISALGVGTAGGSLYELGSNRDKEYKTICVAEYIKAIAVCKGMASQVAIEQRRASVVLNGGQAPTEGSAATAEQASTNAKVVEGVAEARKNGAKEDCAKLPTSEGTAKLDEKVLNTVTQALVTEANAPLWTSCPESKKQELDQCIGDLVATASTLCAKAGEAAWKSAPETKIVNEPSPKQILEGKAMPNALPTQGLDGVTKETATGPSVGR